MTSVEQTLVQTKTGYFWRLKVVRKTQGDPDKYGKRVIVGEVDQEVGGNTKTGEIMWNELTNAKKNMGVLSNA